MIIVRCVCAGACVFACAYMCLFICVVIVEYQRVLGCPKKHESRQMNLQMKILDPFDINMKPEFFQEFLGTATL